MGSKGKRRKGSFAHDYDNYVIWNTHVNLSEADLNAIAEAGNVKLSAEQRLDLKAEIETYASLAEAERGAPAVGGSGRSSDFADQHYVNLAKIYQSAGGVISLGRRNPSRKYPEGIAGRDIPQAARIIAVVDAWDAISARRPYHRRRPEFLALTEIRKGGGTQFDPELVPAFVDHVCERLAGTRRCA